MRFAPRFRPIQPFVLALALGAAACETPSGPAAGLSPAGGAARAVLPAEGTATTLDFGTWNIEWFGDTSNGPSNESLQLQNVRDVLSGTDLDLWGLQEVVNEAHFAELVSQLPGYAGLLANDPSVADGPTYYNGFSGTEQKVGIVYKTSVASVQSARIILTAYDYEFAGRPPLEVKMSVSLNGATENLVVIVLHAKAGAGQDDWERRNTASAALKSYLDSTYPTQKVMVIGDFNDDVDVSIVRPKASPYANLVGDSADYRFPTGALSDAGIASTVNYSDMVDHHLFTNEMGAVYVAGSAEVVPADNYIADYGYTTSDHYPVLSRYDWPGSATANTAPRASFTYSCSGTTCTFTDTSTDADGTIASRSWSFGDGATSTAANPSHSYAAGGTYTVSLTVADDDGATGTASQSVAVSSATAGITLTAKGYKVKGVQQADLAWSGAGSTSVDVYRNGTRITATANDGAYTDNIGKSGGGTYAYKVCEAGTTTCSNEASVVF